MKINSLIFLAGLTALASSASATQSRSESETIVLPAMVIEAPRYQPAEQRVNASLKEFRQQAAAPTVVMPELSLLKTPALSTEALNRAAKDAKGTRLAKN